MAAAVTAELGTLRARVEALEALCGEIYQVAGEAGAPVRVLDKLWAAAQGDAIPPGSLLPISVEEFEEIAERDAAIDRVVTALGPRFAARVGQRGGQATTEAKRLAARANGRKGGRPPKQAAAR